jgi:hypothetical protein
MKNFIVTVWMRRRKKRKKGEEEKLAVSVPPSGPKTGNRVIGRKVVSKGDECRRWGNESAEREGNKSNRNSQFLGRKELKSKKKIKKKKKLKYEGGSWQTQHTFIVPERLACQ